jgi:hypothetical protein
VKKNILITGGVTLVVFLLAGAAFLGGQLLRGGGMPGAPSGGSGLRISTNGGPAVQIDIQPSKELPQTPADVRGLFAHRKNNSIFVGTGQVRTVVRRDQAGNVEASSDANGPTVEVVVTNETIIYHDTTLQQYTGQPPAGERIQQVLEPGSLDDLGESSLITVWGRKTGDRVIADVLVYTSPSVWAR